MTNELVDNTLKSAVEWLGTFLGKICMPAAEEFGLALRDHVSSWRATNLVKIAQKAERKIGKLLAERQANPRVVCSLIEPGSWADAEEVQEMWAGLLASSLTPDGKDDSNVLFIQLLSQMTATEVRLLNYACNNSPKFIGNNQLIYASLDMTYPSGVMDVLGISDNDRLTRELDHLESMRIIEGWKEANLQFGRFSLRVTSLGLQLFVRCQGSLQSPREYFAL